MSIGETLNNKRKLREINNSIKESGVSDLIYHEDFSKILDFMKKHSASKLIINTTVTKKELQSTSTKRDGDTIIFSPFFDKSGLDDVNIIISEGSLVVSCIEDPALKYYEKKSIYLLIRNVIEQLKNMDKAFNTYEKSLQEEKDREDFLSYYNIKIDHTSS